MQHGVIMKIEQFLLFFWLDAIARGGSRRHVFSVNDTVL